MLFACTQNEKKNEQNMTNEHAHFSVLRITISHYTNWRKKTFFLPLANLHLRSRYISYLYSRSMQSSTQTHTHTHIQQKLCFTSSLLNRFLATNCVYLYSKRLKKHLHQFFFSHSDRCLHSQKKTVHTKEWNGKRIPISNTCFLS